MTANPRLKDIFLAMHQQTDLCLKQISQVEVRLAEWQTNGCPPQDFPLEDYQKIDMIKQRLADVLGILACENLAKNLDFRNVEIDWSIVESQVCLGETKTAIIDGVEALEETHTHQGELVFF